MKKSLLISIILLNIFGLSANATFIEKNLENDLLNRTPKPTYTSKQLEAIYNCKFLESSDCYEELLKKIENDWLRMDYAKALFDEAKYDEAEEEFDRLYRRHKNSQYTITEIHGTGYSKRTIYDPNKFAKDSKNYLNKIEKIRNQEKIKNQQMENQEHNMSISQ